MGRCDVKIRGAYAHSRTFTLLEQEGHLVAAMLAHGLTSLRSSGLVNKGALYSASFHLCIGIERMMKLVIVLDHMALHKLQPPTGQVIKSYQHDLSHLLKDVRTISANIEGDPLAVTMAPRLNQQIMQVIGMFGSGQIRYFNIEALATIPTNNDPLVHWHDLFDEIIANDVSKQQHWKARMQGATVGAMIDRAGIVAISDLRGSPLCGETMIRRTVLEDEAARFATFRVIQILDALKAVLVARCYACLNVGAGVPYMGEFFTFFTAEKAFALKKRRWIAPH